jgi:hypothetical protein
MTDEIIKKKDTDTQEGPGKCSKQRPDCLYHEEEEKKTHLKGLDNTTKCFQLELRPILKPDTPTEYRREPLRLS